MRKILSVALIGLLGFAQAAQAKEPPKEIPALTGILSDPQSILYVIPSLPDTVTKIDPTVVRVFLYNERKRDETEPLAAVVENRLNEELLRLRRFKVIEAREAKTTRVESSSTSFQLSNTIESLSRLRSIGQSVGADAVMMYAPQIQDRMVLVSAKLVKVSDGEILWTDRFAYNFDLQAAMKEAQARADELAKQEAEKKRIAEERRTRDNGFYVYTGMTGYSMRRSRTSGAADQISPAGITALGAMVLRNVSFADNVAVGLDGEFDLAGSINPNLPLSYLSVTPMLFMRLDPLFVRGDNHGVVNLYLGAGETVMFQQPNPTYETTGKAGLMLRFTPETFLNLGMIYQAEKTVTFSPVTGLANTVEKYGGLTYQVTFGYAFK